MATGWLARLSALKSQLNELFLRLNKWTVSCVGSWHVLARLLGSLRSQAQVPLETIPVLKLTFFYWKNMFFSPLFNKSFLHSFCLAVLVVSPSVDPASKCFCLHFFLWWFSTIAHVEIINFKPCQNHFPHMHGIHSSPAPSFLSQTYTFCSPRRYEARIILFFSESKSPCGFVTLGTSRSWEPDWYCLISYTKSSSHRFMHKKRKEKTKGWGFMQAALADFPHTSLGTPNIANLHRFKALADMKYSTACITITTHSRKHMHAPS